MKVLVVYDTKYGNTEQIAQAIGNAVGAREEVGILKVGDVQPEQLTRVRLLIVGSPTQAMRPTLPIKNLLAQVPRNGLKGVKVAAFDTRMSMEDFQSAFLRKMVGIFGYAAESIAKALRKKGGDLVAPPEGFIVTGNEGPLKEGEIERAAAWAHDFMAPALVA